MSGASTFDLDHREPVRQHLPVARPALPARANGAGDDVGQPEQWLRLAALVVQVNPTALGQVEPDAAQQLDVPSVLHATS